MTYLNAATLTGGDTAAPLVPLGFDVAGLAVYGGWLVGFIFLIAVVVAAVVPLEKALSGSSGAAAVWAVVIVFFPPLLGVWLLVRRAALLKGARGEVGMLGN